MKRFLSAVLLLAMLALIVSQGALALSKETEKSAFEKNSKALHKLISNYDNEYVPDIVLDESDGLKIKGDDFSIPTETLIENCAEEISVSSKSKTANKAYAKKLGYEVEINDDSVTLSQPYQTHRLIVKGENIDKLDSLEINPFINDMYIVQFDDLESTLGAFDYYKNQSNIEFVNPDVIASADEYMDDEVSAADYEATASSTSWGSAAIGFNSAFKWKMGLTIFLPKVYVAVVDTGLNYNHSQIKDRIIRTKYNNSYTGSDENEYDDNGHGTHVAGIIAQNTLSNVKIMGYKVLDSSGHGPVTAILDALTTAYYAGAQVINLSLSAYKGNVVYDAEHEVYSFLLSNNVTCCVSAGNDGTDCRSYAPAQYEECITVAAMDENDSIPSWSNFGRCVDIIAPGVNISSADYSNNSGYINHSGTSMASPFVTAAVANVISKNSKAKPLDIKDYLKTQGRDINAPARFYGAYALYLGNIKSFDMPTRPDSPKFSVESGTYIDSVTVSITSDDDVDIYYKIERYAPDAKRYELRNPIKYTEPIEINKKCNLVAICRKEYPNNKTLDSVASFESYFFDYSNPEEYFTIDNNGTIIEYIGKQNDVYVPDTVDGITVTAIGSGVFRMPFDSMNDESINYLKTIRLPDTCTKICDEAFLYCNFLTTVNANNIQTIGYKGFYYCSHLKSINLENLTSLSPCALSLSRIEELKNDKLEIIPDRVFASCVALVNVDLPNVKSIGEKAFDYCYSMKKAYFPSLEIIGEKGFWACSGLEYINFPSLEIIENEAFYHSVGLEKFDAPHVKIIGNTAFSRCINLENADIPLVTSIGDNAFNLCESLKSITIGSGLESIGEAAFKNCPSLTDVYYDGTKSQWESIEIKADNEYLLNADIHFMIDEPEIQSFDGNNVTVIDKDGNTNTLVFADYLNNYSSVLDVVPDGIINAKDYAYLLKNYS